MKSWLARVLFFLATRLEPRVARRSRFVPADMTEPVILRDAKIDPRHVPVE